MAVPQASALPLGAATEWLRANRGVSSMQPPLRKRVVIQVLCRGLGLLFLSCCSLSARAADSQGRFAVARAGFLQGGVTPLVQSLLQDSDHLPGLQVGLIWQGPQGIQQQFMSWGSLYHERRQAPQPESIYEIASLTKPFAATLLALAAVRGQLKLDDPIKPCFGLQPQAYCYRGKAISWRDLATHYAGLPALPDNLELSEPHPTRSYRPEQLHAFLRGFELERAPGQTFDYSTLGYGLLGALLAEQAGAENFADLLQTELLQPLGLNSSGVKLAEALHSRQVHGYIQGQAVTLAEDLGGLTASGGLKASAQDLLHWLAYQLGVHPQQANLPSELQAAIDLTQVVSERHGAPLCKMALGWQFFWPKGWYWHSGSATGGKYFMAFDRQRQFGLIMLTNTRIQGFKMEPAGLQIMQWLQNQSPNPIFK